MFKTCSVHMCLKCLEKKLSICKVKEPDAHKLVKGNSVHVPLVVFNSLQPHGLEPDRLLCPWNFPSKNTGVGCHFLLQGIFPTQGSKLCLLHLLCKQEEFFFFFRDRAACEELLLNNNNKGIFLLNNLNGDSIKLGWVKHQNKYLLN